MDVTNDERSDTMGINVSEKHTDRVADRRSFDVTDRFGRVIGARVVRSEVTRVQVEHETNRWVRDESGLGHFFVFEPSATRGGRYYGAYAGRREFRTLEERETAIAKYFADAEKRALKNAGR